MNMSERFRKLESHIQGDTWLGNPVFQLNSHFQELMSIDADWILGLPAFQSVENIPEFRPLSDSLRFMENLTDIAKRATLLFAETAHGINRRYNAMDELVTSPELSSFPPTSRSESFYRAVAIAHNEVLRVPDLLQVWRSSVQTNTIQKLERRIQALQEPSWEEENVRERRQLAKLKQLFQEVDANAKFCGVPGDINLNFTGNLPVAVPGNLGVIVDGLSRITQLFLSFFSATIVPGDAIPAIVQATNAIILKFFNLGASRLLNDMAVAVLRTVDLPAIYGMTTRLAGAWAFLMAYAPPIILAAICAIAVIQNSRGLRLGDSLHVFAGTPGNPSTLAFGGLANPSRATMKAALIELAEDLANEGGYFEPVMGFVLDSRDRVAMAVDLTSLEHPIELFGKAMEVAAIPYQHQLGRSVDDWWTS